MAPHSSTLAWKIPWTEEPDRLQSMGSLRVDKTERLHFHFSLSCIGEGNGNPHQYSCLENPRDGGAWWAAVYGVAQSRKRLKWLSSSSSSMCGCKNWTIKKAECPRIDAFELWCWRTLESSLGCKEIKPVNLKGNQSWIFIGRTEAEAEAPILWPNDVKNGLIGKNPNAGQDWRQEEMRLTEDGMVGWYHQFNGD